MRFPFNREQCIALKKCSPIKLSQNMVQEKNILGSNFKVIVDPIVKQMSIQ